MGAQDAHLTRARTRGHTHTHTNTIIKKQKNNLGQRSGFAHAVHPHKDDAVGAILFAADACHLSQDVHVDLRGQDALARISQGLADQGAGACAQSKRVCARDRAWSGQGVAHQVVVVVHQDRLKERGE